MARLPDAVNKRVELLLRNGLNPKVIAEVESIAVATVYRMKDNLWLYGEASIPLALHGTPGRPSAITDADRGALRTFLESKPWAYQSEIQDYLLDERGVIVAQSMISATLKRIKISQKSLRKIAAEREDELRCNYIVSLSYYTANQLVFLDESAANEYTCFRKRGWLSLGIKAIVKRPLKRSERFNILPAYYIDSILAYFIK